METILEYLWLVPVAMFALCLVMMLLMMHRSPNCPMRRHADGRDWQERPDGGRS